MFNKALGHTQWAFKTAVFLISCLKFMTAVTYCYTRLYELEGWQ